MKSLFEVSIKNSVLCQCLYKSAAITEDVLVEDMLPIFLNSEIDLNLKVALLEDFKKIIVLSKSPYESDSVLLISLLDLLSQDDQTDEVLRKVISMVAYKENTKLGKITSILMCDLQRELQKLIPFESEWDIIPLLFHKNIRYLYNSHYVLIC